MTSLRARRAALIITASVSLFALTACTPTPAPTGTSPASGGSSAPTASPTPTATLSSLDSTAPSPLINISCDDLAPLAEVQKAYPGAPLVATTDLAAGDLLNVGNALPVSDFVRADGGIECLYDTQPDNNYRFTGTPHPSFEINVVFNAAASWTAYQKLNFFTGNNYGACDVGICQTDDLVNGSTWIDILELEPNPAQQSPVLDSVETTAKNAVKNAGTAPALPAPDAATVALGTQCPDFIANSDVQSALGVTMPITAKTSTAYLEDTATYSTWDAAQDGLHDHPCTWKSGGIKFGALNWIPAGAWAWKEAQTHSLIYGPAKPLVVTGLHSGDGAWVRCNTAQNACITDLVIGGNWIEASLAKTGPSSKLAAITSIATAIVAKLG
jgi:hypothetical protein